MLDLEYLSFLPSSLVAVAMPTQRDPLVQRGENKTHASFRGNGEWKNEAILSFLSFPPLFLFFPILLPGFHSSFSFLFSSFQRWRQQKRRFLAGDREIPADLSVGGRKGFWFGCLWWRRWVGRIEVRRHILETREKRRWSHRKEKEICLMPKSPKRGSHVDFSFQRPRVLIPDETFRGVF